MIARSELRNPLRWYLLALLLGMVLSLLEGYPQLKFQAQRLAQILPALGLLAWTYRRQPAAFFREPVLSGWYGLGLLGLTASSLLAGALGGIPWISLGFLGLVLLFFGLLPLLQPAWREHGADSVRMLALFAVAVLGMDVGIWLLAQVHDVRAYAWVLRLQPDGEMADAPYLFMNARWANQLTVVLIWSFLPLLQQLQAGVIAQRRRFWWAICWAVPILAMAQIVLNRGDGAFLGVAAGTAWLALMARRELGDRLLWRQGAWMLVIATGAAALLSLALDAGAFFGNLVQRNAQELRPVGGGRLLLWWSFLRATVASGAGGVGIPTVPGDAAHCTPHNLWVGLLYWTGLVGTGFASLLATAFVPLRWRAPGMAVMAVPLLISLFLYQLVDDIWMRSLALAVLLVVLPGLKLPNQSDLPAAQLASPQWLQRLAFPAATYRLLAVIGVLLITISTVVPSGMGFGPSDLVTMPRSVCLLFF